MIFPAPGPRAGDGFRVRGPETSRLEGFSDAVFGFALTLIVVSLEVPRTFDRLLDDLKGFGAFAICFALFVQIWHQHNVWFRRYGLQDALTVALNGALLLVVLAYVYPLRFLFTVVVSQATGFAPATWRAAAEPALRDEQVPQLMYVYGAGFAAVSLLFVLLYLHAWRLRDPLRLDELERYLTRAGAVRSLLLAGVGLFSIAVTALGASPFWAGNAYFLIGPALTAHGVVTGRRKREIEARMAEGATPAPAAPAAGPAA